MTITSFIFWWMPLAVVLGAAAVIAVLVLRRRRRGPPPTSARPVAHSERLTALPRYRSALARYRLLLGGAAAFLIVAIAGGVALASRPASATLNQPDLANRDIVLCLDVSGSMVDYDAQIVDVFADLSEEFTGERIALVLFNASAVTYFPLSSDYSYIAEQLERLRGTFEDGDTSLESGTLFGNGSSLIGDGLASCAQRFDTPDADRSRSIILATDNLLAGEAIFSLPQAGELAVERDIRVYGINPGDTAAREYLSELSDEFQNVVRRTGGAYYALDDPSAVPDIVDRIIAEQAAVLPGTPQLVVGDVPQLPFIVLLVGITGFLVLVWRVRR
ncbi:MAG: VWA domain-containing protein [Glaciihabitans sp.]